MTTDWQSYRSNLRILGFGVALSLAIVGALSGYWSFTMTETTDTLRWWVNWLQDVGTEMIGSAVTILLVELVIYQKRDEMSRIDQARMRRREHLTSQLSRARNSAQRQRILDRMVQQNLLAEAWLYGMDLQEVNLSDCDFFAADLYETDFSGAVLKGANLRDSNLRRANLSRANLQGANLRGTDLVEANLEGTDLQGANLDGADMTGARFNGQTRLPDGKYWSSSLDLEVFLSHIEPASEMLS